MKKLLLALITMCMCGPIMARVHHPETMADFNALINTPDTIYLVDFYADWCGPCKMALRDLPALDNKFEELDIIKINVDNQNFRDLKSQHVRSGIPMFVFMQNGGKVDEMVGYGGTTKPLEHKTQALIRRSKKAPVAKPAPVAQPTKRMEAARPVEKPAPKIAAKKTEKPRKMEPAKTKRKKDRKPKGTVKKQEKKAKRAEKKERKKKGKTLTCKSCKKSEPRKTKTCRSCPRCK